LLNGGGRLFNQRVNGFDIAEPIAGDNGVLFVQLYFVFVAERRRNATLRVFRRRFAQTVFGNYQNAASGSQVNRSTQTGNPCPYYYKVGSNALKRAADNQIVQPLLFC
jgi:hypothetical protein